MRNLYELDLRLFDGAGAAGAGAAPAAGSEGATGISEAGSMIPVSRRAKSGEPKVLYGKQETPAELGQETPAAGEITGTTTSQTSTQTTSDTLDAKKAEFEKLIKGDYKDLFNERIQGVIDKRFAETKTLQTQLESLQPVIDILSQKYGEKDVAKLAKAIESDDSYYEAEALEKGLSVPQLKELKKIERENTQLRRAVEQREQLAAQNRIHAEWMQQGEALKGKYPNFDFAAECNNPQFVKMLGAGVDVQAAYEAVHLDDIIGGAMQYTANQVQKKTVENIKARAARPAENGLAGQNGVVIKNDVTKLTAADRREIAARVARGELIQF